MTKQKEIDAVWVNIFAKDYDICLKKLYNNAYIEKLNRFPKFIRADSKKEILKAAKKLGLIK